VDPTQLIIPEGYLLLEYFGAHDFGWVKAESVLPLRVLKTRFCDDFGGLQGGGGWLVGGGCGNPTAAMHVHARVVLSAKPLHWDKAAPPPRLCSKDTAAEAEHAWADLQAARSAFQVLPRIPDLDDPVVQALYGTSNRGATRAGATSAGGSGEGAMEDDSSDIGGTSSSATSALRTAISLLSPAQRGKFSSRGGGGGGSAAGSASQAAVEGLDLAAPPGTSELEDSVDIPDASIDMLQVGGGLLGAEGGISGSAGAGSGAAEASGVEVAGPNGK
jgi:hypothetical protein